MADPLDRNQELINAILGIAETGRNTEVPHPSIGCSIKWHR
jgi:hypothetical protein